MSKSDFSGFDRGVDPVRYANMSCEELAKTARRGGKTLLHFERFCEELRAKMDELADDS